jgi:hypothetical protein
MFLTNEIQNIEDFLKALQFIPPKGMDISMFTMPVNTSDDRLTNEQFNKEFPSAFGDFNKVESNVQNIPGITDTITYTKKQARNAHSFNDSNFDINAKPTTMPKEPTKPELLTSKVTTYGGYVENPIKLNRIAQVVESTMNNDIVTIQLKEQFKCFPKNTIFTCVKRLSENVVPIQIKKIVESYNYNEINANEALVLIQESEKVCCFKNWRETKYIKKDLDKYKKQFECENNRCPESDDEVILWVINKDC